jgi:spoIIIJ-associated protein
VNDVREQLSEAAPGDVYESTDDQLTAVPDPVEATTVVDGDDAEPGAEEPSDPAPSDSEASADGPSDAAEAGEAEDDEAEDDEADADEEDDDDEEDDSDANPLDSEAEIAADYLEELLDIADLDGDIDTYIEGERAHVSIVSQSEVLVGANGEVLDALQELTRLAVMTETGDRSRLMLDVAGYRDRRRQELVALAADAIEEVKSAGEKVALAPMNPFERKIVHDAVAAAGLTSESEGEEPKRHVVVMAARS